MRKFPTILVCLALALLGLGAAQRLTVLTHDSFALPSELLAEFTARTGVQVTFLQGGDAGEVVNRAVLTKARPLADLLFGVDDSLLERVRSEGIFEPYASGELARVDGALLLDVGGLVTPVDVGYVLPNIDTAWFAERGLVLPAALEDLADEAYRGLTVVENPASSSPGLAFLLATVVRFGDPEAGIGAARVDHGDDGSHGYYPDWLDYWAALTKNDVAVADGWSDAYYTVFTRYGGDRPVVVSYATSPAAEVIFGDAAAADTSDGDTAVAQGPTANLQCAGCGYRQVEGIGILAGTPNRAAAEAFVDFMLSREVQSAIPLAMFVDPVVTDATLPPEFERYARVADGVVADPLPAAAVETNQARWLRQWTAVVLQGRDPASVR